MSTTDRPPVAPVPPITVRKKKWITPGKIYKRIDESGDGIEIDSNIDIPETDGIVMPDGKNVYGEPVNARLAIFYIRKLWQEIEKLKLLTVHEDTMIFMDIIRNHSKNKFKELKEEDFEVKLKEIEQKWKRANDWLIDLLRNSFGITMDKSVLLKTLSQPECEGIRYYLAMKRKPEEEKSVTYEGEIKDSKGRPVKLTLVTVGVDKKGTDLHYEYDPEKVEDKRIPDVENKSLCTEYPRTPGIYKKHEIEMEELKPYVLYKYAISQKS
jgi:hypothetical protein